MKTKVTFVGNVLLEKREFCARDIERLAEKRGQLVEEVRKLDAIIAATKNYLRELDAQSGEISGYRRGSGRSSIQEMTLEVLGGARRPMRASEIIEAIQVKFDHTVKRTSISPILSKMAKDGKLLHVQDVGWSLP
jgi:chromosome segregation ATPase